MTTLRPLKVLYHLHPALDTLDLTGPLEILSHAVFPSRTEKIFQQTLTSASTPITTSQGLSINRDISLEEAYKTLGEYDILVIPGGGTDPIVAAHEAGEKGAEEPMALVKAFCSLPRKEQQDNDPLEGERILMSVCTGSLFLALAGTLSSPSPDQIIKSTTHPIYYPKLSLILGKLGARGVVEDRFVVNKVNEGGLRVITCGGVSSGIDGALWVVEHVGGEETKKAVEKIVLLEGQKGLVL